MMNDHLKQETKEKYVNLGRNEKSESIRYRPPPHPPLS